MTPCHCGRPGRYAGACFYHAEGFAARRSKAAKKTVKTMRKRYGRHAFDRVPYCRNKLHRMTPENTVVDSRGKRCRLCLQLAKRRWATGLSKPSIRTSMLHHTPKRSPLIQRRRAAWEVNALAEAGELYRQWLVGKNMLDLADLAVA